VAGLGVRRTFITAKKYQSKIHVLEAYNGGNDFRQCYYQAMNRWALYLDIEGTSKIYQSQEACFYAAFDAVLAMICRLSRDVFPETPRRIFPHHVGGDGVVVVSEFAEGKPETPISIGVVLMQVLLTNGLVGKAGISEGTFADIQSCLPSARSYSDKSAGGLLTIFPVMGTALINAHRVATCKPRGARMAVDSAIMQVVPDGVVVSQIEKTVLIVDWVHTWTKTIQEIVSKIDLKLLSQQDLELKLKSYVQNTGQDPDRQWKHNTLCLNGCVDD
jgi:hypothetical protein